jgi:hypothetical protein
VISEQYPDTMSTGHIAPPAHHSAKTAKLLAKRAQLAFTHADLDGGHILVDPATGSINGIMD